jgi:hypothetical protein
MKRRILYKMMSFHSLLLKKKDDKTKKRCHFDCTIHLLLPLDALQGGEKGFFPSFAASLSLSLYLTCSKTPTQPTPPMGYHQDEKIEGTSHAGGPRVVA